MRFSLKWLLVATVYVAIAAAAFAGNSWALTDALWAASFAAFGYALILAVLARGPRQAAAIGFAVFAALYAVCVAFSPASLPTTRWAMAAVPTSPGSQGLATVRSPEEFMSAAALGWRAFRTSSGGAAQASRDWELFAQRRRALNATMTMAAGLLGAVLGTLAHRRGRDQSNRP